MIHARNTRGSRTKRRPGEQRIPVGAPGMRGDKVCTESLGDLRGGSAENLVNDDHPEA